MKFTKTHTLVAAGVLGTAALIGGGFALKSKMDYDATQKRIAAEKEAARVAYENRPILNEECLMNGFGEGKCSFTNVGKTAGAVCGAIEVRGPGNTYSDIFCSGKVEPMTTTKVEFEIPAVRELCSQGYKRWTEVCEFSWVTKTLEPDPQEPAPLA